MSNAKPKAIFVAGVLIAIAGISMIWLRSTPSEVDSASSMTVEQLDVLDQSATTSTTIASSSTTASTTTTTTTTIAQDPNATLLIAARDHVTKLEAYDAPDGELLALPFIVPNPHQFGTQMTLMVTEGNHGDDWVKVQLPIRPNSQEGWVKVGEDYDFKETMFRAEVNLTERHVVVYEGAQVIAETSAVIGSSATPTPLGSFYITSIRENPDDEYYVGPWALALSAFSEVHDTFGGGLPVIAIHGTHRPEQVGESRSNGCLRIPNDVVTFLAENVPIGTPVRISA